jgi:tRNA G10  N-methylase Trm11
MRNIPDDSIDLILCDLPYGVTKCKWDSPIDVEKLWKQYKRIIRKPTGVIALFAQQHILEKK